MNPIMIFKAVVFYLFAFIGPALGIILNVTDHRADRNPYIKATDELLLDLRHQLLTRSLRFDEHFRSLLSSSKISLHNMFITTYGDKYKQNTEIFTNMFESLEQYYAKGEVNLTITMENFFQRLYQKIFQVFNQYKVFTPIYLECATEQLTHLKPFKDIPEKVINGIRRSFVAARTFEEALNGGIDFIKGVISLGQPSVCTSLINDRLIKNTIGQNPNSLIKVPCLQFCEQVITRCIGRPNLEQLDLKWRAYIVDLAELGKMLANNYNVETIITPLDVQISEAIMNFQENGLNISSQVFQLCGKPSSGEFPLKAQTNRLGKRAAPLLLNPSRPYVPNNNSPSINNNHQYIPYSTHNKRPINSELDNHNSRPHYQSNTGSILGSQIRAAAIRESSTQRGSAYLPEEIAPINQNSPILIDEIRNYLLSAKLFWSKFPNAVCTSNHTLGLNTTNTVKKPIGCITEQLGLLDNNSDMRYRQEVLKLVGDLDSMRSKIEQALDGKEIDWTNETKQQSIISSNIDKNQLNSNNLNRIPFNPASMITTTTIAPESYSPETDDQEDTEDDESIGEFGSGNSEPNEEQEEEDMTTTDYPDESETTESQTPPSTEIPTENEDLDRNMPLPPIIGNEIDDIITPGAQKSNKSSSKLVISNESQILYFVSLLFVFPLFIITNRKIVDLSHKSTIR